MRHIIQDQTLCLQPKKSGSTIAVKYNYINLISYSLSHLMFMASKHKHLGPGKPPGKRTYIDFVHEEGLKNP